jgi:hypothetical protein
MTTPDIAGLCERLRKRARASFEANKNFGRKGKEWAIETEVEWQAADTLERQAAEIKRLRVALEEIKALPDLSKNPADNFDRGARAARLNAADIARAALTGEDHD